MLQYKKVHEDARGEITILYDPDEKDDKEIAILRTNAGFARGGCIHNLNDEVAIVVKGIVHYHIISKYDKPDPNTLIDGEDNIRMLEDGDKIFIKKGHPHFFKSLTDSIIIEWGATISEKQEKDQETKKIVDKINEEATNDKKNS